MLLKAPALVKYCYAINEIIYKSLSFVIGSNQKPLTQPEVNREIKHTEIHMYINYCIQ